MAEKGFGVKEVNLIGASGTPTITSPNNLNLNAVNVAISTNVSIGGTLSVTGNVSVGGTLTYEDVTNIDSVGLITARNGLNVTAGVSTFTSDIHVNGDIVGDGATKLGSVSNSGRFSAIFLTDGSSYYGSNKLFVSSNSGFGLEAYGTMNSYLQTNTGGGTDGNVYLKTGSSSGGYVFVNGDNGVELHHAGTSNKKFETTSSGATVTGTLTATTFSGSGASLTNLPVADSDIQVAYTVTANGSSAYRFAGNGVVSTADNPDLYLIRGQKYRFINNSGGSHPFQIREASGGTAYSTGVTNNGAASGNIDFAPTFDSPAQLVYQCTSHGGMVGNIYLKDGTGNETNVGVTTFSGLVHLNQLKKASGTLDYLAGTHNFANAAGTTNYFTHNGTDATLTGATDGVLNLNTTDSRGSFIRYQQGGSTKVWVGVGQGLSLGDSDDLGLRATDKIRFRPGSDHTFILDGTQLRHGSASVVAGGLDDVRIRNSSSYKGFVLRGTGGSGGMANYDEYCFLFNRMGSDGNIITFNAQGSQEGSISVSGSSVAYNGGVLSRWSQLVGISTNNKTDRPTIYQGTVMSNLDEMCEWPGEENMQLNKTEVSTVSGDKNVAGVFWAWDDDDDTYVNDFYIAQTGDYIIRVGAATTVTRGDLLESAGDGTAKPQSDDIVRSKTVAKVTSGIAHTTYPDGTKTYPCVLMGS